MEKSTPRYPRQKRIAKLSIRIIEVMKMAKKKQTFEQALKKLEEIVEKIESGQIGLEESIAEYEKGIKLVKQCRAILQAAEKKVQMLVRSDDGNLIPSGELERQEE